MVKPLYLETTGLRTASAAGLAVVEEVRMMWELGSVWRPMMERVERERVWRN